MSLPVHKGWNTNLLLSPANEAWGKVMILHMSVCPQGEGVMMSLPVMDSTTPQTAPPGQHPPLEQHPTHWTAPTPRQHLPLTPTSRQQAGSRHANGMLSCLAKTLPKSA